MAIMTQTDLNHLKLKFPQLGHKIKMGKSEANDSHIGFMQINILYYTTCLF